MPSYVVRQPNGLLAIFSTIVDDFTMVNVSEATMLRYWRGYLGADDAEAKVQRGIDDDMTGIGEATAADGLNRWRDALDTIRVIHGESVVRERESEGAKKVKGMPKEEETP